MQMSESGTRDDLLFSLLRMRGPRRRKPGKPWKVYVTYLVVEGEGGFPYEMLLHDSCHPETETDDQVMRGPGWNPPNRFLRGRRRRVILRRYSASGEPANEARWDRMGWRMVIETCDRSEAMKRCDVPLDDGGSIETGEEEP